MWPIGIIEAFNALKVFYPKALQIEVADLNGADLMSLFQSTYKLQCRIKSFHRFPEVAFGRLIHQFLSAMMPSVSNYLARYKTERFRA